MAQVAAGFLILPDKSVVRTAGKNPKIELLRGVVKEFRPDAKIIIFHSYQEEARMIEEIFKPEQFAALRSEVKHKQNEIDRFRNDPECRFLITHPKSGGEGLNLQVATAIVFFGNGTHGAPVRTQAEGRIWRLGQEKPCLYLDLLCRGTIDEKRLDRAMDLGQTASKILDFIRDFKA